MTGTLNFFIHELDPALRESWDAKTSASPDRWRKYQPDIGQCAVTALVVQDYMGGDLVRVVNDGESHYYNRLPNGVRADLTRGQFTTWSPGEEELRSRDYVLQFSETAKRYQILKARVVKALGS